MSLKTSLISESALLQAVESQLPQPFLMYEVIQSLHHLSGPAQTGTATPALEKATLQCVTTIQEIVYEGKN